MVCLSAVEGVESIAGLRPEVDAAILAALDATLTETDLGLGRKYKASARCCPRPRRALHCSMLQ